jgi:hypothetical protein
LHVTSEVLCLLDPPHDDESGTPEVANQRREQERTRGLGNGDRGARVQQRHQMLIGKKIEQWS